MDLTNFTRGNSGNNNKNPDESSSDDTGGNTGGSKGGSTGGGAVEYPVFNRDEVINDMFLNNEGIPHGIPAYIGWRNGPGYTYRNNMPEGWSAVIAWGCVLADQNQPNPNVDFPLVRVHIKDLELYVYLKDGTWKRILSNVNVGGELFKETNNATSSIKPDIRKEEGGGISVTTGSGFYYHFWGDRVRFTDRDNIAGFFAVCKARLIGTENYDTPVKYLIHVGADYWRSVTALHKSDMSNNNDIGIGRSKYVTPEWQYFTMHTFRKREIENVVFPLE